MMGNDDLEAFLPGGFAVQDLYPITTETQTFGLPMSASMEIPESHFQFMQNHHGET